jgi:hypothetical protein
MSGISRRNRSGSQWLTQADIPGTAKFLGRGVLDLWDKIKLFFGARPLPPPDARKLAASSENELSASIQALPIGERGWITLRDAWHLFSSMDEEEAFGEMDDAGKRRIGEFAAYSIHRSELNFMPTEGRVYFTRSSSYGKGLAPNN